jgi:hypothetical protein
METSLHRALKSLYAQDEHHTEVRLDGFRIDAVDGDQLVEIQHGSLAAIRNKIARLLERRRVLVVKPIVASRLLVRLDGRGGQVVSRRQSPKRGQLLDLFGELVQFTRVFPHRRLALEVLLVDTEERRYPGHGRRRRWRTSDYQVEDQTLVAIHESRRLQTAADLRGLLPAGLPPIFHSGDLAEQMGIARWRAQQVAYCLRQCGAALETGKSGNTRLYRLKRARRAA